jgi:sugar phosphate isomerase/epimerase
MTKGMSYFRNFTLSLLIVWALMVFLMGSSSQAAKQQLVFNKYTNLKLGFTTQNFIKSLPVTLKNEKILIDYASDKGFSWIELRDPSAVLTLDECREIADYARRKKIEVGYAIQKGLLDNEFWEIFSRAVKNAAVFEGPKTIRSLGCGPEFFADKNKKGWTVSELNKAIEIANKAAKKAKEFGLQYVAENALEVLKGDGIRYFGITEFFANVNPDVGWQFDTANFFSAARVWTKPKDARTFLEKNIGKMFYIHLKTSKDRKAQPFLSDNELDFDVIFSTMSKHNVPYIAIELVALENVDEMYKNHDRSIEYLKTRGFISVY